MSNRAAITVSCSSACMRSWASFPRPSEERRRVSYLSNISLRRGALLFVSILAVLIAGTWITVRTTTDYLLNQDAKETARGWANYLAGNVGDLGAIAAGE